MRIYLSPGTVIELYSDGATRKFQIDQTIGDGANCVAYEAHRVDSVGIAQHYRIKECYPYGAQIARCGTQLVWGNNAEREAAYGRLRKAHELITELKNAETVGNNITSAELCEGNGSLYSVMEVNHAKTYDKDTDCDLHRILETMRVLTEITGSLHEQGYLHLDIKPGNFLVNHRPNTNIWLFDVDSLTSVEELRSGNVQTTSFSQRWAAPEQLRGQVGKLCPATDLYAIGAILFEKVMGRPVSNEDTGLFADWSFEGELFENVNPKVKRHLREIFQKTLSASAKRRYQDADELSKALEVVISVNKVPYLLSSYPKNNGSFVGRDRELADITEAFASHGHLVCLRGLGGIGKSEIAKRYAELHEVDYDAVLFLRFKNSINELLAEIEIQNSEGSAKEQEKQLKSLLNENVLLIIDGLDTEDGIDIDVFDRLKCDILITSRLDWGEYDFHTIEIGAMPQSDQFGLFVKEYGDSLDILQQRAVNEMLDLVEGYTLLIPLIAKQLKKGNSDFSGTLTTLRLAGIKEASEGKVRHLKDGMLMAGTVYGVLTKVLSLAELSAEEEYVMRCLTLLSRYQIDQREFVRWIGKEYLDWIDDLVFSGWVCRDRNKEEYTLALHSVISNLCVEELNPMMSNCQGVRDQIWTFASEFSYTYKNPMAEYFGGYAPTMMQPHDEYQFDNFIDLMWDILSKYDWSNNEGLFFWIRTINKVSNVIYGDCSSFEPFLRYVLDAAMDISDRTVPYISEAALALQAIALQQDDLDAALAYSRAVVYTLDSVSNVDEIIFRMCFNFYQYICCASMDFRDYWKIPGFEELSQFIKTLWQGVVENGDIELQGHDVWVLSNDECNITTDEAIEQAYGDYCWKISEEGIAAAKDPWSDVTDDLSDFVSIANQYADKAFERLGSNLSEPVISIDTKSRPAEGETELFLTADALEKRVNVILPCDVLSVIGLWVVMKPPVLPNNEKETICYQLKQIDPMLPYHEPSLDKKTVFLIMLTKMEAAFSYAYACVEDWERYDFHVANLLKYYRVIIYSKKYGELFKKAGAADINSGLPGAASLLNKHGTVLPPRKALDLICAVVKIMEEYQDAENLGMESLFEVYEMALEIAEEVEDAAAIAHFRNRIQVTSSVFFNKKSK